MNELVKVIKEEIVRLKQAHNPVLVAIDGRCAAGKTTLAAQLQTELSCSIFHMDDFFLRTTQRTPIRLKEPGGNVDYERFKREVLLYLIKGNYFSYEPYDCQAQRLKPPIFVKPCSINIVEGAYACHPALWDYYDLHVFLTIDEKAQLERLIKRNGEKGVKDFTEKWIPMEEKYFKAYMIAERCEISRAIKEEN